MITVERAADAGDRSADYLPHDHYDHLDYATIKALMPKVKRVVTPLGVGSHLRYWGMDAAIIDEVDWTIKSAMNSPGTCAAGSPFLRPWAETQPDLMGQLPVRHPAGKDLLQRR